MAKRSAALVRAEKALAGARKRATDLRKKMKTNQPMEIAGTVAGGAIAGVVVQRNPLAQFGVTQPDLVVGGILIAYGLSSSRSGQAERLATTLGTGMLTTAAYRAAQQYA
jgi:hypothetical protein